MALQGVQALERRLLRAVSLLDILHHKPSPSILLLSCLQELVDRFPRLSGTIAAALVLVIVLLRQVIVALVVLVGHGGCVLI